jgi:NitT/TauT family transport system substrate-binding protein
MEFKKLLLAPALTALLTIFATDVPSPPASHAQGDTGAREKVEMRFTWQFKGEHTPLFMALEKGFYADEGLDVQLAEGSGQKPSSRFSRKPDWRHKVRQGAG